MSDCPHNENNAEYCFICLRERIAELESTTVTTEYHDHIVNEKLAEIERRGAAFMELCNALEKYLGPGNPDVWIAEIERLQARVDALEGALEEQNFAISLRDRRIEELEDAISGGIPSEMIAALKGEGK